MITIGATEFKARCLELLDRVFQTGEKIQVTKRGTVVAEVAPPHGKTRKYAGPGFAKGEMEIVGDIMTPIELDWEAMK